MTKRCATCGENKTLGEFSKGKGQCKPCRSAHYQRKYRERNPEVKSPRYHADAIHRVCSRCGESKPATTEFFAPERRVRDGLRARCRVCVKAMRNRAVERAQEQRWYAENIPRARARSRRWYDKHRAEKAEYDRERYRGGHGERRRQQARATGPVWRANNREVIRLNAARRRARLLAVESTLTPAEWAEILEYFGGHCAYCLQPSSRLTMDHIIPLAAGGPHTADNVVPACPSCNSSKRDRSLLEMLRPAA